MNPRDDESGFTLVEVVVALALFVIVATASTFAIVGSIRASHATDLRVAATAIAQQQMDDIRTLGANPEEANLPVSPVTTPADQDHRTFTITITAKPDWDTDCAIGVAGESALRKVTIQVGDTAGQITPVILDTLLACGAGGS